MKRTILALAMAAMAMPAVPAIAHDRSGRHYHQTDNGIRYWRGNDGRTYCKRPNGTTGLLIGGVAGALVGRAIDTRVASSPKIGSPTARKARANSSISRSGGT